MTRPAQAFVICIQGPTASGKSSLAETVCQKLGGEVVSADSMQIYKGMDIGTAKVPATQRSVPYHCIDILEPGMPYSASLFQQDSRAAIDDIRARNKVAVLCGGTGLYVRAALDNMVFAGGEQVGNATRERYMRYAQENGNEALHALLAEADPQSAELIHPNNVKRVVRAFEMLEQGESYAERKKAFKTIEPYYNSVKIGLSVEVDKLNERINRRVDEMVACGLVDEVATLMAKGFRDGLTAPQAIGYKEIVAYLDGACALDDAIAQIKQATRRYAKRQRTWLRSDASIQWVNADNGIDDSVVDQTLSVIHRYE